MDDPIRLLRATTSPAAAFVLLFAASSGAGHSGRRRSTKARRRALRAIGSTLLVGLGFLAFTAVFTWGVPAHLLSCRREATASPPVPNGDVVARVDCRCTRLLLWAIPYQSRDIQDVTGCTTTERPGKPSSTRPTAGIEAKGELALISRDGRSLGVEVSPASREDVEEEIEGFLAGDQARYQRYLVANWKFGVIVPLFPGLFGLAMFYTVARDSLALARDRRRARTARPSKDVMGWKMSRR